MPLFFSLLLSHKQRVELAFSFWSYAPPSHVHGVLTCTYSTCTCVGLTAKELVSPQILLLNDHRLPLTVTFPPPAHCTRGALSLARSLSLSFVHVRLTHAHHITYSMCEQMHTCGFSCWHWNVRKCQSTSVRERYQLQQQFLLHQYTHTHTHIQVHVPNTAPSTGTLL